MYADDTALIIGIHRDQYLDTITAELGSVVDWFSSNDLLLNMTKTDYLHMEIWVPTTIGSLYTVNTI